MVPPSEQNQRPAAEVKVRWAGDARTSEPLTDEPSHSRGGVADPQERMRSRRKLKTGGGGGRAARHTKGSVRAGLHRVSSKGTHSGASSHKPDTWELHLSGWKSLTVKPGPVAKMPYAKNQLDET